MAGDKKKHADAADLAVRQALPEGRWEGHGAGTSHLRGSDEVATGERKRERFLLNGRRCYEARLMSGPDELGAETKLS